MPRCVDLSNKRVNLTDATIRLMQVHALKTPIITPGQDLWPVLEKSIPQNLSERSVVAITSKILSFAEGSLVPVDETDVREQKHELVRRSAEWYTEPHSSKYDLMLAVKDNQLFVNAGIDLSNANGNFVLWPKDSQDWANKIWNWLREHRGLKEVGVIVTDSKTAPLYWGVTGASIAHCGFQALAPKFSHPDLFGRPLEMTQVNVAQALAGAAVYEMGETNESTPLAVVTDIRDIVFQDEVPSEKELADLIIELEDDVYAPLLQNAEWKKGEGR
jgi:F420-0:gamma-glutamyl ligase